MDVPGVTPFAALSDHQVLYERHPGYASEELAYYPPHYAEYTPLYAPNETDSEDEYGELPGFHGQHKHSSVRGFNVTSETSVLDYLEWVVDCTSQRLSIDADILNAFVGVERRLSQVFELDFIFGLPDRFLLHSLMWAGVHDAKLRSPLRVIPSWSWASSAHVVSYAWHDEVGDLL